MILDIGALIFFIFTIMFAIAGYVMRINQFHVMLICFITSIASIMYFLMASGIGNIYTLNRKVVFFRYLDWLLTTPLLIITLFYLAFRNRRKGISLYILLFLDFIMIFTGFFASISQGTSKWILFGVSGFSLLLIAVVLYGYLWKHTKNNIYKILSVYLIIMWLLYPVVWILSTSGVSVISSELENILYLTLDILSKIVFGVILFTALYIVKSIMPKHL